MFRKIWRYLISTDGKWSPLFARLTLGLVIFPHGAQKVLGWFGGGGVQATLDSFEQHLGIPVPLGVLAIVAEFCGSLGLMAGAMTRVAAFGIGCTMLVAGWTHSQFGFFMNWYGTQGGEGYQFHILAVGLSLCLMASGGGKLSVDRWIAGRESV